MKNRIEDKYLDVMKKLSSGKKLERSFELFDFARSRALAEIKKLNPGFTSSQTNDLVNRRFLHI